MIKVEVRNAYIIVGVTDVHKITICNCILCHPQFVVKST